MHFGVLASELSSSELLDRIAAIAPEMRRDPKPVPLGSIDLQPLDDGWTLAAGDHGGHGFVLDSSFMLSGMVPDLITRLAADSGKLVVGACAETVSGTFAFVAARGTDVIRHHYHCHAELSAPYDHGARLRSESDVPLDDIDGNGLFDAMKELGPDFFAVGNANLTRVIWTTMTLELDGPLAARIEAHRASAMLPKEAKQQPRVIMRVVEPPTKKPWWRFW